MTSVPEIARRLIDGVWQTGVAEDSGGGSQPWRIVCETVAFDTPGFQVEAHAITAVNQGQKKFTIAGDHVAALNFADLRIYVSGSTGNDGNYTVVSAALVTGSTVVTVNEAIVDATVDGDLNGGGGVVIGTPAEGERPLITYAFVTTAFNNSGYLSLGYPEDPGVFFAADATSGVTTLNTHLIQQSTAVGASYLPAVTGSQSGAIIQFSDTEPFRAKLDDGGFGAAVNATQGEAEIVMVILAAAS